MAVPHLNTLPLWQQTSYPKELPADSVPKDLKNREEGHEKTK
jgi:hypothetical protein